MTYGNHSNDTLKRDILARGTGFVSVFAYVRFSMAYNNENHFIKVAAKFEQGFVFLYYVTHGKEPVKIYQKLHKGYVDNTMSRVMAGKWIKNFIKCRIDIQDESRSNHSKLLSFGLSSKLNS